MAKSHAHIKQWKHNREFLGTISPKYADWIVTVAFYVALHAVDALLAHANVERVTSHDTRNAVLRQTNKYLKVKKHYMPLYDLSQTVRYLADPHIWVPPDQINREVLRRYLYPIEESVQKLIGQDLDLRPVELLPE